MTATRSMLRRTFPANIPIPEEGAAADPHLSALLGEWRADTMWDMQKIIDVKATVSLNSRSSRMTTIGRMGVETRCSHPCVQQRYAC